jgi:hypothetical protein
MPNYIIYKNSSKERPRNVSEADYATASFGQEYVYSPNDSRFDAYYFSSSADFQSDDHKKIRSLKNLINSYAGYDNIYNFSNFYNTTSSLITVNSYYLGSGIERGSVQLTTYFSGSILDQATDTKENGVLSSSLNGKVGVVFYKEGIILLNNTSSLTGVSVKVNNSTDYPRWTNFFANNNQDEDGIYSDVEFAYNETVPTAIWYAEANKYDLNHSNNPTYIQSGSYSVTTGSTVFLENNKAAIKNIVKSPFASGSAQFEKETYITKIGLYDKERKLIGVATLANPVRKTENREFIFKLKLDL